MVTMKNRKSQTFFVGFKLPMGCFSPQGAKQQAALRQAQGFQTADDRGQQFKVPSFKLGQVMNWSHADNE